MNCIESVEELVETLKRSKKEDYVAIARLLDIPAADLMDYAYWKEEGYTRNCIERTDDFELLLLCWNPGDSTPIHCHGEQRCWVYQVSGRMKEVIYKENEDNNINPDSERRLKSGDICYMDDSLGYHTLHNNSDARSMSLHLYARPIDTCTYYDEEVEEFVPTDMHYHSYKGELVNDRKLETREERLTRLTKSAII